MLKVLKNKNIIFSFLGLILSLAGVLIYIILPSSELANGIQYSGADALRVLLISPVLLLIGGMLFIFALLSDIKNWKNTISDVAIYVTDGALIATVIFNFAVSLSLFLVQNSLGFVAPYTGLKYEFFAVVMIVFLIWQFILSALIAIETVRESK